MRQGAKIASILKILVRYQSWRLRKKSGCCVALHPSSLRRMPKYASLLGFRAPCLRPFYEAAPNSRLLRLHTNSSSFDPRQILSAAGIDPDLFSLLDERGHLELVTRLDGNRFGVSRYGIPLGPGVGLDYRDIDEIGKADPQRPVLEEEDLHLNVVQEIIFRLTDLILGKKNLLVTLVVHEAVLSLFLIKVLHLFLLHVGRFKVIDGTESPLKLVSIHHVLQLAAVECLYFTRVDKV